MSPFIHLARRANVHASRNWLVAVYTAVVVTLVLVLAVSEALR